MEKDTYLWHVTLQSGDSRKSYRHEVGDEAITRCRLPLDSAMSDPQWRVPLPAPLDAYRMQAKPGPKSVELTIWHTDEPVLTIGIAVGSNGSAELWPRLVRGSALPVPAGLERPDIPWVAARLEPGAVHVPRQDLMIFGDFGRVIAWTWIERREARRGPR